MLFFQMGIYLGSQEAMQEDETFSIRLEYLERMLKWLSLLNVYACY